MLISLRNTLTCELNHRSICVENVVQRREHSQPDGCDCRGVRIASPCTFHTPASQPPLWLSRRPARAPCSPEAGDCELRRASPATPLPFFSSSRPGFRKEGPILIASILTSFIPLSGFSLYPPRPQIQSWPSVPDPPLDTVTKPLWKPSAMLPWPTRSTSHSV